jgi:hypothetical protein
MEDRYLFRGKRADTPKHEWIQGSLLYLNTQDTDWTGARRVNAQKKEIYFIVDEEDYNLPVLPESLGQCIGRHAVKSYRGDDPEDLLIFEGDIAKLRTEKFMSSNIIQNMPRSLLKIANMGLYWHGILTIQWK